MGVLYDTGISQTGISENLDGFFRPFLGMVFKLNRTSPYYEITRIDAELTPQQKNVEETKGATAPPKNLEETAIRAKLHAMVIFTT